MKLIKYYVAYKLFNQGVGVFRIIQGTYFGEEDAVKHIKRAYELGGCTVKEVTKEKYHEATRTMIWEEL